VDFVCHYSLKAVQGLTGIVVRLVAAEGVAEVASFVADGFLLAGFMFE
jgi:hypothetical protein